MKQVLLLLGFAIGTLLLAQEPRFIMAMQYPPDQRVTLPFYRTGALDKIDGEATVHRKKTVRVKMDLKDAPPPSSVKPEYKGYVLWAVDPKAKFVRLGELSKNLAVETSLLSFGLVVSLEADPEASKPSGMFVLETGLPQRKTAYFGMTKVVYTGQK